MNRWRLALAGAVVAFALLPAANAAAHASLLSSNPADGGVLAEAPPNIELHFSEEVLASASSVVLLQLGPGTSTELQVDVASDGTTLVAALPALGRGEYIVRFTVRDPVDLHTTKGAVAFGIGVAAPTSEVGEEVVAAWPSAVLRGITDAGVIVAVGAAVLLTVAVRQRAGASSSSSIDLITRIAVIAGVVIACGWIAQLLVDVASLHGSVQWGSLLLHSDPGRRALVGAEIAAGVWFAARLVRAATRRNGEHGTNGEHGVNGAAPFASSVLLGVTLLFVVAAAYGGHAGIGGSFVVGFALRLVHYLALGMWLGVVAVMWWVARRSGTAGALWPDVTRLAAVGLAAAGASGLLMTGRVATTVTALLGTTYGRTIVIKMAVLAALAVIGLVTARRIRAGSAPRLVRIELALAGVALVLAGLLAGSAPAVGARFEQSRPDLPQVVTTNLADLTVSASIEPARPGPNLVQVRVLDTRRPAPGVVGDVMLAVIGPDGTTIDRRGAPDGGLVEWPDVELTGPGSYAVTVTVTRDASPVPVFRSSWRVAGTPQPRARTVVSTADLAPITLVAALAWLLLVLAVGWAVRPRAAAP